MGQERRRTPRYPFVASAELVEQRTDVRMATRVSELSLNGCYLDMMNPYPIGTLVVVKISAGEAFFEAKAQVVYSQTNMGAGVAFFDVEPQYAPVLQRWLDEAQKEQVRSLG